MDRAALKLALKAYEAEFKREHNRVPAKADIAQNKEIAAQYKAYNRSKANTTTTPHSVPGLSKPSPRKIRTLPVDPKSWERVFDPTSRAALELGPSPLKPHAKPFVPLLGHSPPPSTSSSSKLLAKFTASGEVAMNKGKIVDGHPTLVEVRGVKRSAEDPEAMPFEFDLPAKAAKLKKKSGSRWENSDISDDDANHHDDDTADGTSTNAKGRAKGKGKAKVTKAAKPRAAVGRGGKGYKKAKKGGAVDEEERELGVKKQLGGGVKALHRKDAEGNLIMELELADAEEDESDAPSDEEMVEDGAKRKKKVRFEKITIHSRRPYHRDGAIVTHRDSDEEAEEEVKDTTTLFYRDNHDLLLSQDVFAAATTQRPSDIARRSSASAQSDDDDDKGGNEQDERAEHRQNRSPVKSHPLLTHSLDPTLLALLSLRSSPTKSTTTRERDFRIKKLLMEPLERGLHEKPAGGLEDLEVLERRRRGLGTRLEEEDFGGMRSEEEMEMDDDWEEEAEGWKGVGKGEMDGYDWVS